MGFDPQTERALIDEYIGNITKECDKASEEIKIEMILKIAQILRWFILWSDLFTPLMYVKWLYKHKDLEWKVISNSF